MQSVPSERIQRVQLRHPRLLRWTSRMAHYGRCSSVIERQYFVHYAGGCRETVNGRWDLIIAHPPCTDLAVSGAAHFAKKQKDGLQQKSIVFFMQTALAWCDHVAVENPICIMSSAWRKPDQIIQPYQFGHEARKSTCLWLRNLPKLIPTNIVDCGKIDKNGFSYGASATYAVDENGKILSWNDPRTAKARSKTFQGIADAMAEQWGNYLLKESNEPI